VDLVHPTSEEEEYAVKGRVVLILWLEEKAELHLFFKSLPTSYSEGFFCHPSAIVT